ncbi:MAG: 2-C-methyl-D-erythritol 4-phosphate cytidylyltransferase [Chloroflexi bacterium]|nr:2-C-methyl-D-erythritol 4-phosphate cytidylyltransferase [Chloroflexota bacterium]
MPPPGASLGRRAGAILVAAGESRRMQGADKLFMSLLGRPLLSYALAAFEACHSIVDIVLVVRAENLERGRRLVQEGGFARVAAVCEGGPRRQDSVRLGLERLPASPWVVVHDGARPCVQPELIEEGLTMAERFGCAVAAVPLYDTVKRVDGGGQVEETLDRLHLWAVQTPQVFPREWLSKAHQLRDVTATDDAALVERLGYPVHVYLGSPMNIKVTTPQDLLLAEAVLRSRGR